MKHLVYCIFSHSNFDFQALPAGIDGQPVSILSTIDLDLAYSIINELNTESSIAHLLIYHQVIESFNRHLTVIPMRYPTIFANKSKTVKHLTEWKDQYLKMLEELDGCVEMGIRILNNEHARHILQVKAEDIHPVTQMLQSDKPGTTFLKSRKEYYKKKANPHFIDNNTKINNVFKGLFVDFKEEDIQKNDIMSSLYYLVPRENIKRFKKMFHRISSNESPKLLLSGPWPPYNFVQSELNQ
ncbi:MAG: GvpL/GvpF family gas vesicle protein [Candidatus Hatepunaea meridiana]|nr:GvpL/GvpF family gas vesicle protein [Candidatus Hatepunaea meridiana]